VSTPRRDILELVNKQVLEDAGRWSERFAGAQPFPHVVVDNFLTGDFCREICRQFPGFDEAAAINENGLVGAKATQEKVRSLGPAYRQMDDLLQSPEFLALVGRITGIDGLRYDPWYFGGGTHENRLGQDLDPHIDFNYHPLTRQHRRLNLIIYLNEEWDDAWGGSLQLHRDPHLEPGEDEIVTVTPLLNRCVIFETSEHSWHGFERIELPADRSGLSRRSFAVYFYTDSRPAVQTAAEHSTVYVERHLPRRFAEGYTLDAADVQELKRLLDRRDQHLQRLYRQLQQGSGQRNQSWFGRLETRLARKAHAFEAATSIPVTPPLRALRRLLRRGSASAGRPPRQ
jgi:2OG-Fe(II) oxygenase superfamily